MTDPTKLLRAGTLAWALILLSSLPAHGQITPDLLGDVDNWCIQHSPCDYASHAAVTMGASVAIAQVTGWEAEEARWVPVGLYAGKEVYDHTRWPDLSWSDTALDMASVMVGAWIAPRVEDWLFGKE